MFRITSLTLLYIEAKYIYIHIYIALTDAPYGAAVDLAVDTHLSVMTGHRDISCDIYSRQIYDHPYHANFTCNLLQHALHAFTKVYNMFDHLSF